MEKFKGALLVGALRLFALLPWRAVQAVGTAIGWIIWKTPNRSRETVRINLSKCFPDMDPAARERLVGQSLMDIGKSLTESACAWIWPAQRSIDLVREVEGLEVLHEALASGKGVVGITSHAFARSQGLVQHFQALDFADQVDGALRRPDPRAGAFGQRLADVFQTLPDQTLTFGRIHLWKTLGEVDPHHVAGTVGGFPHDPADRRTHGLHGPPWQQGKQPQSAYQQGAFKLFHRSLLIVCGAQSRHSNRR